MRNKKSPTKVGIFFKPVKGAKNPQDFYAPQTWAVQAAKAKVLNPSLSNKKSSMNLSINAIILLVIVIFLLGLSLTFIKTTFTKAKESFEEQALREPEPSVPVESDPITVSRRLIITSNGDTEVLKVNILNPTGNDWVYRDVLNRSNAKCGNDFDDICLVDYSDITQTCNNLQNAKLNDNDCMLDISCSNEGYCLIDFENNCPPKIDPDCGPIEKVEVVFACEDSILDKNFRHMLKEIPSGKYQQVIVIGKISLHSDKKDYACQIKVLANELIYRREVIIRVK